MRLLNRFNSGELVKFRRFAVVGLLVMCVFMVLNRIFNSIMSEQAAFFCSYPPSVLIHFLLNKFWTFSDRKKVDLSQFGSYFITVCLTFIIQWSVFTAIHLLSSCPSWAAAGIANIAQMSLSYIIMKSKVFALSGNKA